MSSESYTRVPAELVITCATRFIEKRKAQRAVVLRQEAENLMRGIPWLRRLTFGWLGSPKAKYIEQANILAEQSEAYRTAKWVGGYWEGVAESLLALARKSSDGTVLLSDGHVWILEYEPS